jgi:hypothetical protein
MNEDRSVVGFHVSDLRIEVETDVPRVREGLTMVWGQAGPVLEPARIVSAGVMQDAGRVSVWLGARRVSVEVLDALPTFEAMLYASLPAWHPPPRVLLHAAGVAFGEQTIVLAGPSGSGKSTLATALVRSGGTYLSDELLVFDGARLWGIPRAPQFEPIAAGQALPPWLREADLGYVFRTEEGEARRLPVMPLASAHVARRTYPSSQARLCFPTARLSPGSRALDAREALVRLVAECRSPLGVDLGPLLEGALELGWTSHPDEALAGLQAA